MTDSNNIKVLSFYANKIHNNPEFDELEKKKSCQISGSTI